MLLVSRAIACGFLLFSPCVYGQSGLLERRASSFNSKGVGLTETLLKFAHEEHLPIAIEYIDRASMDRPINVSLQNKTNRHGSKHAEGLLNKVIPVFKIPEGETAQMMSTKLWWQLQIALDTGIKGFMGDIMGKSSTVKAGILHNREVREILSYIVVNSLAEAWVVAGPPECLGYTPYCGLWYIVEQESSDNSNQSVLRKVRENL